MTDPLETLDFNGDLDLVLEFLKRTRWELRALRKVHVFRDRVRILDVNGDSFEVRGVGYPDATIGPLLQAINTAFDPKTIHDPPPAGEYKELFTGRRHAWAEDRVM